MAVLDLRHLYVLRAIAREGSLAGAARSLHYSQPTVTHHLATLEGHFGARLVERGPRGATLSEVGRALLPHAEAVVRRLGRAEDEVRALLGGAETVLRVGAFPTASALLLPRAVRQIAEQGVTFDLTEGELPALLDLLRRDELHVALVFTQPDDPLTLDDGITLQPVLDDPLDLVLPPEHPCARLDRVPLKALREEPWIVGTTAWDPCDRQLDRACEEAGYRPLTALRSDDYGVIQGHVAAGAGVALVPRLALNSPRADIVVRPVDGARLARRISAATVGPPRRRGAHDLVAAVRTQADRIAADWREAA